MMRSPVTAASSAIAFLTAVVAAMREAGIKRVIWVSANGIYGEIPGAYGLWNEMMLGSTLDAYAAAPKSACAAPNS